MEFCPITTRLIELYHTVLVCGVGLKTCDTTSATLGLSTTLSVIHMTYMVGGPVHACDWIVGGAAVGIMRAIYCAFETPPL